MKAGSAILITVVALCGLYALGYWVFIKRDLVTQLPSSNDDPFETSGLQGAVKDVFEPARELDLRRNHDAPLRRRLIGTWKSESTDDFVTVSEAFDCRFQLGDFAYNGAVEYERAYAGFFTEFQHGGQTHVFIFSPATGPDWEELPEHLADAFIGHDPEPRVREQDYISRLTKQAEHDGAGQPATAPEPKSEGEEKPQPESKPAPR